MNSSIERAAASTRPAPVIVVIGGGFSGAMTAANLLRGATGALDIILIEPRPRVGLGVAYSTNDPGHLLNVPCEEMGARPDDVGGFRRWAEQTFGSVPSGAFLPRADYGRYIEAELAEAVKHAHPAARLTRRSAEAQRVEHRGDAARVHLSNEAPIDADVVVLALGSGPPRVPTAFQPLLGATDRLAISPFAPGVLEAIAPDDRVLMLGAGLTMYDLAISLASRNFAGSLLAVSRRGLSHAVHAPHERPAWAAEWAATLAGSGSTRELVRRVREAVERARDEGKDWRGVIDAMRPYHQSIWRNLSMTERGCFFRHVSARWDVHRHRCAPEIGAVIASLRERGTLEVLAGRVISCALDGDELAVEIESRSDGMRRVRRFDRIVLCAGPEADVMRWRMPLMRNLLAEGLLAPDELRLGARANEQGMAISRDGADTPWLRIVGPLRKAQLGESTAVPELRVQAAAVAEDIHRMLNHTRQRHLDDAARDRR